MEFAIGNKRTYTDFEKQIPDSAKSLFDEIRKFCLSLSSKVVEDVRMHRIVFGKSMTFRWFADVEPEKDGIIIKIQQDRKQSPEIIQIKLNQDTTKIKQKIRDAFENIH